MSKVEISLTQMVKMRIKGIDSEVLLKAMIMAKEAKLEDVTLGKLESHYLAEGNVTAVVEALIAAKSADVDLDDRQRLNLTFATAAGIDLAKKDVISAVEECFNYRVVETEPITAFTRDGIRLTMKARITIRAKIKKIIGCPGEETVLARINEAIVSLIGSTDSHQEIVENPHEIAETVLSKEELFEDTAFTVISIDISGIEIGEDVHAGIEIERAKAKIATEQAKEQKMRALAEEARAHHIKAESEVAEAMAEAFRKGNLSIHDYHKIKNTEADTEMRESIAKNAKR